MTSVRRGQLITPFGVGAVVDIGPESYTCVDISQWRTEETIGLPMSTLAQRLRRSIRAPLGSVPFYRFPRWHFCPKCRDMHRIDDQWEEAHQRSSPGRALRCPKCRSIDLTPIGFVQACEDGHLDEIDWFRWAHRSQQRAQTGACGPGAARLRFTTSGASGGDWNTLVVSCSCGASASFEDLTTRPLPWGCTGRQPWQALTGACTKRPIGLRRGSSNLYYPNALSGIDVDAPVGGSAGRAAVHSAVRSALDSGAWAPRAMIENMLQASGMTAVLEMLSLHLVDLSHSLNVDVAEVREAFSTVLRGGDSNEGAGESPGAASARGQEEILIGEWSVFSRETELFTERLIVRPQVVTGQWTRPLGDLVKRVALVPRLREVRVLTGFRRIDDQGSPEVPVDMGGRADWLPGVEVWGEGIFIEFEEEAISQWEHRASEQSAARLEELAARIVGWGDASAASARFIALHTLSHLIMRRLAFDAGYSSSSLRERIYAARGGAPMAGILIYTADADSEGSLGGLVQMGDPGRLEGILRAALADGSWCSADPVCGETERQGTRGMNGAACHACALVAETSCTHGNQLLDRRMLINLGEAPMNHGLVRLLR